MKGNILETIGSPLVEVSSPAGTTIAAKVESFNPGGSAKDRPARAMVEAAEAERALEPGDTIVEATSGNTGIGLAMVGAAKGYDVRLVMPEGRSAERQQIMRAYGADLELIDGTISDARDRVRDLASQSDYVGMKQFENPANPDSHYRATGPEILDQIGDRTVDALVAGIGTGGTISGVGRGWGRGSSARISTGSCSTASRPSHSRRRRRSVAASPARRGSSSGSPPAGRTSPPSASPAACATTAMARSRS
ncbi:hypothetical protein BRD19_03730 [Halobacteriales archaeon SW_7_65_23]|nr:MAG: hypothetical protein BRD19_03730 [Halobacteriales archaeon SW_7_65_23]